MQTLHNEKLESVDSFLARFRVAAELDTDILLDMRRGNTYAMLEAVFGDPGVAKVGGLIWYYELAPDVKRIIPLLVSNCPGLERLEVRFMRQSGLDFLSAVLEAGSGVAEIKVPLCAPGWGDCLRFFRAVLDSKVRVLKVDFVRFNSIFNSSLEAFLQEGWSGSLEVDFGENQLAPFEKMLFTTSCRLTKLVAVCGDRPWVGCRLTKRFMWTQGIFVLLQAQQLKHRGNPLCRLPVEMIRMVAAM